MGEIFFLSAHQIHTRYRNNTMMGASTRVRLFEETLIPHTHTLSKITKDAHRHIQIVMIQLIIALQYYPKKNNARDAINHHQGNPISFFICSYVHTHFESGGDRSTHSIYSGTQSQRFNYYYFSFLYGKKRSAFLFFHIQNRQ